MIGPNAPSAPPDDSDLGQFGAQLAPLPVATLLVLDGVQQYYALFLLGQISHIRCLTDLYCWKILRHG